MSSYRLHLKIWLILDDMTHQMTLQLSYNLSPVALNCLTRYNHIAQLIMWWWTGCCICGNSKNELNYLLQLFAILGICLEWRARQVLLCSWLLPLQHQGTQGDGSRSVEQHGKWKSAVGMHIHMHTHTCTPTHTHPHIHTHTYTPTHPHMHTHTNNNAKPITTCTLHMFIDSCNLLERSQQTGPWTSLLYVHQQYVCIVIQYSVNTLLSYILHRVDLTSTPRRTAQLKSLEWTLHLERMVRVDHLTCFLCILELVLEPECWH